MRFVASLLAAYLLAAPSTLEFSNPEAKAHFETAQQAFADEDYALASEALGEAHKLEPLPRLLYARAQAERLSENWPAADVFYAEFLTTGPPPAGREIAVRLRSFVQAQADRSDGRCEQADAGFAAYVQQYPDADNVDEANAAIGTCEVPPEPAVLPVADPVSETPTNDQPPPQPRLQPPPPERDQDRNRWYADPLGGVLLGTGVAAAAAGGVLLGTAGYYGRLADAEGLHSDVESRIDGARRFKTSGIVAAAVGGALLTGAVVRYIIVSRQKKRSTVSRRRHQLGQRRSRSNL